MGKMLWMEETEKLLNSGCKCRTKGIRCRQGICNRIWGTQVIKVVCGFTYSIFPDFKRITEDEGSQTRFARFSWKEGDVQHRDIGLLVEDNVAIEFRRRMDLQESKEKAERAYAEGTLVGSFDPTV